MTLRTKLSSLIRIHLLLKRKATGNVKQLSKRLDVSRPTVFRYLNELRNFGAPIAFCRQRQSYYYQHEFELEFGLTARQEKA